MTKVTLEDKFASLQRDAYPMPEFVKAALLERNLLDAYHKRPAYQQNDYLGWITRAKRQATANKRLEQMLSELEQGGIYMNMPNKPSES